MFLGLSLPGSDAFPTMIKMLSKDIFELNFYRLANRHHQLNAANFVDAFTNCLGVPMMTLEVKRTTRSERKKIVHFPNFDQLVDHLFNLSFVMWVQRSDVWFAKYSIDDAHDQSSALV